MGKGGKCQVPNSEPRSRSRAARAGILVSIDRSGAPREDKTDGLRGTE